MFTASNMSWDTCLLANSRVLSIQLEEVTENDETISPATDLSLYAICDDATAVNASVGAV